MEGPAKGGKWMLGWILALCLINGVYCGLIGIDYGQSFIKAALVMPGIPMDIILNEATARKEAAAVAFKADGGRLLGNDALAYSSKAPDSVYLSLKQLLGQDSASEAVKKYKTSYSMIQLSENNRSTVDIIYHLKGAEKAESMPVEEVVAMQFARVKALARARAREVVQDIVITIPPYFSSAARLALMDAAEIAGLRVVGLVHDGLAVAINYALSRTFSPQPVRHIIYDMGAGSTSATVVAFNQPLDASGKPGTAEVVVEGVAYDEFLGGDAFNERLLELLLVKFMEQHEGSKIRDNPRAIAKLRKEATRVRQILSANMETTASVESLHEDIDFRAKVTREEFEQACSDYAVQIVGTAKRALEFAGKTVADIESIIITGGSVRVPFVQRKLEELVGESRIGKQVNGDEAAVMGATFRGAAISGEFKTKALKVSDIGGKPIIIEYFSESGKPIKQEIFTPSSLLGTQKTMSFKQKGDILLNFTDPNMNSKLLAKISAPSEGSLAKECSNYTIKTTISLNLDSLVSIADANAVCELSLKENMKEKVQGFFEGVKQHVFEGGDRNDTAETVVPNDNSSTISTSASFDVPPNSSSKSKIKDVKLQHSFSPFPYRQLDRPEKRAATKHLQNLDNFDREQLERGEARNELETIIYKGKEIAAGETYADFTNEIQRADLDQLLVNIREWMEDHADSATSATLKVKIGELKEVQDRIIQRQVEAESRSQHIDALQMTIKAAQAMIASAKLFESHKNVMNDASSEPPSEASFLKFYQQEDITGLEKLVNETVSWLGEKEKAQAKLQSHDDPVLLSNDILARSAQLERFVTNMIASQKKAEKRARMAASRSLTQTSSTDVTSESYFTSMPSLSVSVEEDVHSLSTSTTSSSTSTTSLLVSEDAHDEL